MNRLTFMQQSLFFRFLNKFIDLGVVPFIVGYERCSPNKKPVKLSKANYVFHYVIEGEGIIKYDKKVYHAEKDMLFIIPADRFIEYMPKKTNPWQYMWIEIAGDKCGELFSRAGIDDETIILKPKHHEEIKELFYDVLEDSYNYLSETSLSVTGKFIQIIDLLITEKEKYQKTDVDVNKNSDSIKFATIYIQKNYYKSDLTAKEIADEIGFSLPYLSKLFKKFTGTTISKYIINTRMQRAYELLCLGNYTITEIAQSVGYNSPYYFSKEFKRAFSVPPSKFKTTNQGC